MDIKIIKKLREETGAGVMDTKRALDEAKGDVNKAKEYLKVKEIEKAKKKSNREIKAGKVFSYVHNNGKVAALLKLGCETDFVAKNDNFSKLGDEIVMQIAAMDPTDVKELLDQDYIRDTSKKINDLITDAVSKIGENITIEEFFRQEV